MEHTTQVITNSSYSKRPFTNNEGIGITFLLFILMITGVSSNIITMLVIRNTRRLKKDKFFLVIFSLCISDLIASCISWISWYRRTYGYDDFSPIPSFICSFFWGSSYLTTYATSVHVLWFAALRFVAIRHNHIFKKISLNLIKKILLGVWLVSFAIGFIPASIWHSADVRDRNSNSVDANWPSCSLNPIYVKNDKFYELIAPTIILGLSLVGVLTFSSLVASLVYLNSKKSTIQRSDARKKQDHQAIVQLFLIVIVFFVGYVPITGFNIWVTNYEGNAETRELEYWLGFSSYIIQRFCETLNPFFYNLGSYKLRNATQKYFANWMESNSTKSATKTNGESTNGGRTNSRSVGSVV